MASATEPGIGLFLCFAAAASIGLYQLANVRPVQRAASTTSRAATEASPLRLNVAAAASTAVAVGSIAWYYHLYGPVAQAMTPAEEG